MKNICLIFMIIFFSGCALKKPILSQSATIMIKTPTMKFYDKGFISNYADHTKVQIYSAGQIVLDLMLYENQVCQSTFECMTSKEFNKEYLHPSYKENFLKNIFEQNEKNSIHADRDNRILIKIKKD